MQRLIRNLTGLTLIGLGLVLACNSWLLFDDLAANLIGRGKAMRG